nr:iron ABC transporter permease [uncultured Sphingomonas sp.]
MKRLILVLSALAVLAALLHLVTPWSVLADARAIDPALATTLLVELRLPRTILVLIYGIALGVSGAALQAMFANPLASPDLTGASSGAALGAVIGGYWLGMSSPLSLAFCGVIGALALLSLLFLIAGRRADTATLLLAGLAVSLAAGAATSLALALAPSPFAFYDAFDWLMGNFTDRSPAQAVVAAIPALAACALLIRLSHPLNLLALGEDVAASLGHSPRKLATTIVICSAIAVGACVSVVGAIGFVGLIAPYFGRRMVRGRPGSALLPAGLIGAILLIAADGLVRLVPLDRPIPVGVLTSLLGTPLFIWIVVRMKRSVTA